MADFDWPADIIPFAASFYLQPYTGGSESPFSRQTKTYGLGAPRWVCRISLRAPWSGDRFKGARKDFGERIDAFMAQLQGRTNRVRLWDFRRPGTARSFTNAAAVAGATELAFLGASIGDIRAGEYVGGDGRPHLITQLTAAGSDVIARIDPPLFADLPAGEATFERVTGLFRLTSDDAAANPSERGQLTGYDLEFVEDWLAPEEYMPAGIIDPAAFGVVGYENAYDIKFWSTGRTIWPLMLVDSGFRDEWRDGGIEWRDPLTGDLWASVCLPNVDDPTMQGAAFNTYHVDYDHVSAADSGAGTNPASPWKRVNYALANAVAPYLIIVHADWVGSDSFPASTYTHSKSGRLSFVPKTAGHGKTWITQCREGWPQSAWAFSDNGDGSWTSASATPGNGAKNAPADFDLLNLDADGAPSKILPVASKAICRATPGTKFCDTTTTPFEVTYHLVSGAKPNPGVNWAYCEVIASATHNIGDTKTLIFEDARFIRNDDTTSAGLFFRPTSVTTPGPRVAHDATVWLKNVEVYGSGGNAGQMNDIARGGGWNFKSKHCRDDRLNFSTFYTYAATTGSNRALEGRHIHNVDWVVDGSLAGEQFGETGFNSWLGLTGSSNICSAHSQLRATIVGVRGGQSNGCPFAFVAGAKAWLFDCFGYDPLHTGGGSNPRAVFWEDGVSDAASVDSSVKTEAFLLFCKGRVDPTGHVFGATNGGAIEHSRQRGAVTSITSGGGTVTDVG